MLSLKNFKLMIVSRWQKSASY